MATDLLEHVCDAALVASLKDRNPKLLAALDAGIAKGMTRREILRAVADGGGRGTLTEAAILAYLDQARLK